MSSLSIKQFHEINLNGPKIRKWVREEFGSIFTNNIDWLMIREDLENLEVFDFDDKSWFHFKKNFNDPKKSPAVKHFKTLLFWLYNGQHGDLDSEKCVEAADRICERAFHGKTIDKAYREQTHAKRRAFSGSTPSDEFSEQPDPSELVWQLEPIGEPATLEYGFIDCPCHMTRRNTGADQPAQLGFRPYLEMLECEGLLFGFKEAYIETTLKITDSRISEMVFHESYRCTQGAACRDANVVKHGPSYAGIWLISKEDGPLDGDYELLDDTIAIDLDGTSHEFSVAFGVHHYASSVCWENGDPIENGSKEHILEMLLGEIAFRNNRPKAQKIPLREQSYRLSKVNP